MSFKSKREYLGRLIYRESKELVGPFPLVWVREDSQGGWTRLKIKFDLNGLIFEGGLVPPSASAIKDTLKDLVQTCQAQGVPVQHPPTKAVSFSSLVKTLEELHLLNGPVDALPADSLSQEDPQLAAAHKSEVSDYVASQTRSSVDTTLTPDLLSPLVKEACSDPYDMTNVQFIVEASTEPNHVSQDASGPGMTNPGEPADTVPSQVVPGKPPGPPAHLPPSSGPGADLLNPAVAAVMVTELTTAKETIANLNDELARVRSRNLQLEDHASTDRFQLTSEIGDMMNSSMNSGFQTLEISFANKVAKEMRAEISRQNSLVMEEVCVLKGMKSVLESTHSRVNSLEDSLSDIAGGIGVSRSQIALLLEKVSAGAPVQSQVNLLTEIRNGLSANTALLTETLKGSMTGSEVSCLGTIPGKAAYSAPLTPILTPKHTPIRKCSDCGSITHLRADCPDKLNFCSRCLSRSHKVYSCPPIHEPCGICKEAGRGDFAFGHSRKVHQVVDREKRDHITQYLPKMCFPEWAPSPLEKKRKHTSS